MSVMQRKLFANKEARTKLRDMGGIMSSFPELSGEVQRFRDGKSVIGSGMTPDETHRIMLEDLQRQADEEFRRDLLRPDSGMTPDEINEINRIMLEERKRQAEEEFERYLPRPDSGMTPDEINEINQSMFEERKRQADEEFRRDFLSFDNIEDIMPPAVGPGQTVGERLSFDNIEDIMPPAVGPDVDPFITYEQWKEMSTAERKRMGLPTTWLGAQDYFNRVGALLGVNDPETGEPLNPDTVVSPSLGSRKRGQVSGTPSPESQKRGQVSGTPNLGSRKRGQLGVPPSPEVEGEDEIIMVEPPSLGSRKRGQLGVPPSPEEADQTVADPGQTGGPFLSFDDIEDIMPPPPGGGEDGKGEDDPDILRSRAEKRIELFQDLFGSDKPTARDKAMQFAMIGLAIAAGQSPNALTNIASGLLAGTEAMSEQEEGRRKTKRDLQQIAVESVLEEMQAEREASGVGGFQDREAFEDTLRDVASQLQNSEDFEYENFQDLYARAWDIVTQMPAYASYRNYNPYKAGAAVEIPSDTTALERDMITGGRR